MSAVEESESSDFSNELYHSDTEEIDSSSQCTPDLNSAIDKSDEKKINYNKYFDYIVKDRIPYGVCKLCKLKNVDTKIKRKVKSKRTYFY